MRLLGWNRQYPSYLNNSEAPFGLEPPILTHIKHLQPGRFSEAHREFTLQQQQSNASHSEGSTIPTMSSVVLMLSSEAVLT
ncbi:hypothetical protein AHAS_Ahas15G0392700 [Arachis hypogaea]